MLFVGSPVVTEAPVAFDTIVIVGDVLSIFTVRLLAAAGSEVSSSAISVSDRKLCFIDWKNLYSYRLVAMNLRPFRM